jgi:hypothetical protein
MLGIWADTHHGQRLDGVLSVDPVALARVLEAIGPVATTNGVQLTASNAVSYTLSTAYARFPTKAARSEVLTDAARVVIDKLTQGAGATSQLTERLGSAVISHHVYMYSASAAEQRELATTDIAGVLRDTVGPQLMVVTQDAGATKLSYYLRRRIDYQGRLGPALVDVGNGGPQIQELGQLKVTLTNTAPAGGLPAYVTGGADLPEGPADPVGQSRTWVSIYLAHGGQFSGAKLDGQSLPLSSDTDAGLAVFSTTLTLNPGDTAVLSLDVSQPTAPAAPLTYRQQPLVTPDDVHITRRGDSSELPWEIR